MVALIPLLTALLRPRDCRTFFWNSEPSLMPGNVMQSLRGIDANNTLVPAPKDFSEALGVDGVSADELALDDVDGAVVVIDEDGVDLLVVCPIRDVGLGLVLVTQVDVAEIPGDEPLPVVREVLDVVILLDLFFDLVEHGRSPWFPTPRKANHSSNNPFTFLRCGFCRT